MNSSRYNKLSIFLREKFGGRVEKICVDGGFTCPNRDGSFAKGGCAFCGCTRNESIHSDIAAQVVRQISSPKNGAEKFIVYFQDYTNTYAPIEVLKAKYDAALTDDRIAALAIATRPDCIDGNTADLIALYANKYYVWVELGLQTSNDKTAEAINRGYATERFTEAVKLLTVRGIDVVAHVIFGLPGETDNDIDNTIDFVNASGVRGIKIHSLYITENAPLFALYASGAYIPQTFGQYTSRVVRAITRLRPDIIIHRITGDCPRGRLVAPDWNNRKKLIRNEVERRLLSENVTQGCLYNK